MMCLTLQQKRATAAWWALGAILLAGLVWTVPAQGVTVDGMISSGEWADANVIIADPNEPGVADNYDIKSIYMKDGENNLFVGLSVWGDHPALAASESPRPYLNFYFNLYADGGPVYRLGLTYNDGYGFDPGGMHLVQYDGGWWKDLGQPAFAINSAVEVAIPWSMLPEELTSGGPIAVQDLFFLYNVVPGDANNDGSVDGSDLSLLLTNWNSVGGAGWFNGDFNLDGCVDGSDLSILLSHFGYSAPGGAQYDIFDAGTEVQRNDPLTKHTPEPLTILAVFTGIAGLAGYIRRRRMA